MAESNKKYFIYINEDYLFDNAYRKDEFNDKIISEMLDLEIFLKDKYPCIDYNIIYFNFRAEHIPTSSKIMNIILKTDQVFDNADKSPYEKLRSYCGKILSELFNTEFKPGYDMSVFYN
jgi:hypothetical protein